MRKSSSLTGREKLYSVWSNMRNRCNNPKCKDYPYYGGKGVKVCDEWSDYGIFRKWAYANGYVENAGVSIDRIDVNGMYSPDNCRWATKREQMNNMSSNHLITYNGETHTMAEWAVIVEIPFGIIESRLRAYRWDVPRALTTPVNGHIKMYEYNGEKHTIKEWAKIYNINIHTLYNRINVYGWGVEKALKTAPRGG